jgi:uncharacterized membrane protein SpoIIM required for sporulation
MIIDLQKFIENEKPNWEELESILNRQEKNPLETMNVDQVKRFHYLYERVSADLAKIATFATERETRQYLEQLVARAYGEIHETREIPHRFRPIRWLLVEFPITFRRHLKAFYVSVAITLAGCLLGGLILAFDSSAKEIVLPYGHLLQSPSDRVAKEEKAVIDRLEGTKAQMAAWYIRNNTQVSISAMALGLTWGIGTIILLFSNGMLLGAVLIDYILDGQTRFLVGWLLPHGSFEIPAILLAGQAGLVLAGAMIGWGRRTPLRQRLRDISHDLVTLIGGVCCFLVWAGVVEAFLSQYHEPALPYFLKIAFGVFELLIIIALLGWSGRKNQKTDDGQQRTEGQGGIAQPFGQGQRHD